MAERSTVVVVTWQGRKHLTACLDALAAQSRTHRVLVVDNASRDGTAELITSHWSSPDVLRLQRNSGYAGGISAALRQVRTPMIAWLNDDAVPEPGWLAALEDALDSGAAAASSVLCRPDGSVQSTGVRLMPDGHGADAARFPNARTDTIVGSPPATFAFCGGAALLRTDRLLAIGGVPAEFFCYYEDTDTSWRLRLAGEDVVTALNARALHLHGASTKPGSARFHRWNERNRLLTLLRCAPAHVATREIARFAAITLALPLRRALRRTVDDSANFRATLRLLVLTEVVTRLPAALVARRRIERSSTISRRAVWQQWAGADAE